MYKRQQYVQYTPTPSQEEEVQETRKPELEVDFAALQQENPDICGWIFLEGSEINYPVVQGKDNSYYLNYTASGEKNSCLLYTSLYAFYCRKHLSESGAQRRCGRSRKRALVQLSSGGRGTHRCGIGKEYECGAAYGSLGARLP